MKSNANDERGCEVCAQPTGYRHLGRPICTGCVRGWERARRFRDKFLFYDDERTDCRHGHVECSIAGFDGMCSDESRFEYPDLWEE